MELPSALNKYLYTNREVYCCDINIETTFNDVSKFDYMEPIKRLKEYYHENDKKSYYDDLYQKYKNHKFDNPISIKDYDYDMDEIVLQYVACFPQMSCLIVWPICDIHDLTHTNFYSTLKENGIIHAIKEINLTKKQVQGVIFQIYYDKSGFKDMNSIKGKQEKSFADQHKNKFFIIFFEADNFSNISGKDAPFKIKLREQLRKDSKKPQDTKLNFFLHVSDNHTQVVELSQLFFNKNSLRLLQYQRLDRLFYKNFQKSLSMVMTYKNWLYQEIKPLNQIRFLLFSSAVLYSLGLRDINDLDLMVLDIPTNDIEFNKKVDYFLDDKETRFPYIEMSMKGKQGWFPGGEKEYLTEWFEKEWPSMFGATSMTDVILNPRFHYYYFGVKIVSMEGDIKRRLKRNRPAAFADVIALNILTNQNIEIPPLPEGYWKSHEYHKFTHREVDELQKKIKWYLKKRYNLDLELPKIKEMIRQS